MWFDLFTNVNNMWSKQFIVLVLPTCCLKRYVCMYAPLGVCMYVCLPGCMYVCPPGCMCVCMYVCPSGCMYVCIYVCMYMCMHLWGWGPTKHNLLCESPPVCKRPPFCDGLLCVTAHLCGEPLCESDCCCWVVVLGGSLPRNNWPLLLLRGVNRLNSQILIAAAGGGKPPPALTLSAAGGGLPIPRPKPVLLLRLGGRPFSKGKQ